MSEEQATYTVHPLPDAGIGGETYRERHGRVVRALGLPEAQRRLVAAGLDPTLYWRGMGITGPTPGLDECRRVADALGFSYPELTDPLEVAALVERWTAGEAGPLRVEPVFGASAGVTVYPDDGRIFGPSVAVRCPSGGTSVAGLEMGGLALGWPLRLAAYLIAEVPWLRDLHWNGDGA